MSYLNTKKLMLSVSLTIYFFDKRVILPNWIIEQRKKIDDQYNITLFWSCNFCVLTPNNLILLKYKVVAKIDFYISKIFSVILIFPTVLTDAIRRTNK